MSTADFVFLYVIPLTILWAALLIDLVSRDDIGIGKKVAWGAVTLLTAEFGAAVYIAMRPLRYPEHGARPGAGNPLAEQLLAAAESGGPEELAATKARFLESIR